jgi:dTDP-4-amino-4,6-dideoxygalactose transaminase
MRKLAFNRPYTTGHELEYIRAAIERGHLAGNGAFTKSCCEWLQQQTGAARALLTHSCTAALEMAALLTGVGAGDEVIMPSYTFVSTANAFVLRGATPVFVDIDRETLNMDLEQVEAAITPRTKVVAAVHYAGVSCDMDRLREIVDRHGLLLVEDAAQALMASHRGRPLGSFGTVSAISFHETKNVISGEGGALLVNDPALIERAEILQEKGTDRSRFFRGQVDKYSWVDVGSSYVPSEINAAFLWAQLEHADEITAARLALWEEYDAALADAEGAGYLRRPIIPPEITQNAHMYYVLLHDEPTRAAVIERLRAIGAQAVFHYVPLHSSVAGRRYGRPVGDLPVTDFVSERLLRLPLWVGMTEDEVQMVAEEVIAAIATRQVPR